MDYQNFNKILVEHRNSLILIGVLIIIFAIIGIIVIEIYVRRVLDCKTFQILNYKFSPTLLIFIPIIISLVFFSVKITRCNNDLKNESYIEYEGTVECSPPSIRFIDSNTTFYVGKGHEIIPKGRHYGKVIYSREAKVIVFFEKIENTREIGKTGEIGDG